MPAPRRARTRSGSVGKSSRKAVAAPVHPGRSLDPGEIEVIERLVKSGNLIAIPSVKNAKPRRIEAAALHDNGRAVLLYLSRETTSID